MATESYKLLWSQWEKGNNKPGTTIIPIQENSVSDLILPWDTQGISIIKDNAPQQTNQIN